MDPNDISLTFDDVLIVPQYSEIDPNQPNISSSLAKGIKLHKPFVGSPMVDVSEPRFCIAMAQQGAFAFLHRDYTVSEQVSAVRAVKDNEGHILSNPVTVTPTTTIGQLKKLKKDKNLEFSSFPVVDEDKNLVGIITETDYYLESADVLVGSRMSKGNIATMAPNDAKNREKVREILREKKKKRLLIVDENNHLEGIITGKDFLLREQYKNATRDSEGRLMVGGAIGVGEKEVDRAVALYNAGVDAILIDISHGHSKNGINTVKDLRKKLGDGIAIGSGNIVTAEAVKELYSAGIDFARIGIGAGSICTTREVLGAGRAQIDAILDCAKATRELGIYCMADGGIKQYGDIAKALAAGADTVMMGNLFAGTEETPGKIMWIDGRAHKEYKGMASESALENRSGAGAARYEENINEKAIPQGVEGVVYYKGSVKEVLYQMSGALKRSFAIVGASDIDEFHCQAVLKRITSSVAMENKPSVQITKQPKNYFGG